MAVFSGKCRSCVRPGTSGGRRAASMAGMRGSLNNDRLSPRIQYFGKVFDQG
jgi:hypothetical protein